MPVTLEIKCFGVCSLINSVLEIAMKANVKPWVNSTERIHTTVSLVTETYPIMRTMYAIMLIESMLK